MRSICFSSIKGGTGKTSLCILVANYAAAAGYRVLVADLDIQNSTLSYYLDSPDGADRKNIASVLHTERLAENILHSDYPEIDLLASSLDLAKKGHRGRRYRGILTQKRVPSAWVELNPMLPLRISSVIIRMEYVPKPLP